MGRADVPENHTVGSPTGTTANPCLVEKRARALLDALEADRRCHVCTGRSPSWDGHDRNPPCVPGAAEMLREVLPAVTAPAGDAR